MGLNVSLRPVNGGRVALDGLKVFETSLRAAVAALPTTTDSTTLSTRLNGLALSLEAHQALSKNLAQQIAVLESMKAGLTSANAELDGVIAALHADNDVLMQQIEITQRAVSSTLIDLAIAHSKLPQQLDIGALSLSTKALLLDGIEGLRLEVYAQAKACADTLLTTGLLGVSSDSVAGRLFLAALGNDRAAVDAIVADTVYRPLDVDSFMTTDVQVALAHAIAHGNGEQRHLAEQMLLTSRANDDPAALASRASSLRSSAGIGRDTSSRLAFFMTPGGLTPRELPSD